MEFEDRDPLVSKIEGRKSLLKQPFSLRLRAGSVVLAPGENVGEHTTSSREEALIVLSGTATVECKGEKFAVPHHHLAYIPPEALHNVFNETEAPVEYVYLTAALDENVIDMHSHGGEMHAH
jgi:mannose-6-phosphate isomerase-like protein (cupin superfamily)